MKRPTSSDRVERIATAESEAAAHLDAAATAARSGQLGEFLAELPTVKDQVAGSSRRTTVSD